MVMHAASHSIDTTQRSMPADPGAGSKLLPMLPPALVLLFHALAIRTFEDDAQLWSFGFLILAPLMAAAACYYRARGGSESKSWSAVAIAMILWSGGMAASAISISRWGNLAGTASISMLLFVLYGVPLIFVLTTAKTDPWYIRLVDGALALILGYLFFIHTFAFSTMSGEKADGFANLLLMFDIENLFIAVFAMIRFLASADPARRAFFRTLTIFAVTYLIVAGYINHQRNIEAYGSWPDLLIALPFLILTGVALRRSTLAVARTPSMAFERVIRAGSPFMLPATLLVVSAALVRSQPELAVAGFFATTIGHGLRNILTQVRSYHEHDKLERLSAIDALTGVANRRHFDENLDREWRRACRHRDEIALLIVDIDHFKMLNDTFGHPIGDVCLRAVAQALASSVKRSSDIVARYGGEEFAAILPSSTLADAHALAEIMRTAVYALNLASPAPEGRITVSIGIGCIDCEHGNVAALTTFVAATDAALYDAKHGGRNRASARVIEP